MGLSTLTLQKVLALPACHENSVRLLTHLSEHCDMSGPLEGIKILDLTTVISGPSATMLLADQGADVIKIESMHRPDHARGAGNANQSVTSVFLNNNRNKRALALDLKTEEGVEVFFKLAATADVVIQNFRPGVVDRLGIGEDALRSRYPGLIYVSISGFGDEGPLSHKPVYDPIIQAISGLTTVQAGSDAERPRLIRTIVPDKLTGIVAAQAISSALVQKLRTGEGQHVKLSMLDAVINFLWSSDMGSQTFVGREVEIARAATFIDLIYETTTDYISVSAMTNQQWQSLADAVGRPEWKEDDRFKTPALRDLNANERLEMTQAALKTESAAYWLERLEEYGVPCAPVLTRSAMINHPQVKANKVLLETEHPVAGRIRQARPAAQFSSRPYSTRQGAPKLGEHSLEVLSEIGLNEEEIEQLMNNQVIAGSE